MKFLSYYKIQTFMTGILMTAVIGSGVTSCVPGDQLASEGNNKPGTEVTPKPDPEGTRQMALYSDTGDNIAGLGFSHDGYLTSLSPTVDWFFASVGEVPGLGNVDYIPMYTWDRQIIPEPALGFVAYSPSQGFVRFYVDAIAVDPYDRKPVGIGVKYLGSFTGSDNPVELDKTIYTFSANGGTITAKVKGNEYVPFQFSFTAPWLDIHLASSLFDFINDRVEIKAEPNPTAEERTAELILTTSNGKMTRISILQSANPNATTEE